MKKIISMVVILMVVLSTTAFAYGVRGTNQLSEGICVEMPDGTQIISLNVNDEEDHVIYFTGSDDSVFVLMQVMASNGIVVYEDTIYNDEMVICDNLSYVCYCIDLGWL